MSLIIGYRFRLLVFIILCAGLAGACNLVRATPTPFPSPTPAPATPTFIGNPSITPLPGTGTSTPSACPPPAGWVSYTIQVGDTLTSLAASTFVTVDALITGNCLTNPDDIRAGEVIYLPMTPALVGTESG